MDLGRGDLGRDGKPLKQLKPLGVGACDRRRASAGPLGSSPRRLRIAGVAAAAAALLGLWPGAARAQAVRVQFSAEVPARGLFPSDVFSAADPAQNTGLRVALPVRDCTGTPMFCQDLEVLNGLDGFNLQPRLTLPFSAAIDVSTVTSANVFLLRLADVAPGAQPDAASGARIGINQRVFSSERNTVFAESDQLLDQHTRYALVVTRGVRDARGNPLAAFAPEEVLQSLRAQSADRAALLQQEFADAFAAAQAAGVARGDVAGLSVFTTQSATAVAEQIRDQIRAQTPMPASFALGDGGARTVFALGDVTSILFMRQVATNPTFVPSLLPVDALRLLPDSVAQIAFGRFAASSFLTGERVIRTAGTRSGRPAVQETIDVFFNLFLPAGPPPPAGWPVAIFGHDLGDHKNEAPLHVASTLAASGIATIAINAVGHGGGPLSTLTVNRASGPSVTLSAGGLGRNVNPDKAVGPAEGTDKAIGPTEGIAASSIIGARDGMLQTVANLMQLVREIEIGMDVDGNGTPDLDAARISYLGQSFGAIYGAEFLAVEPTVRLGVLNAGGGPLVEIGRLGTAMTRGLLPLRDQPMPLAVNDPNMIAAQEAIERGEWVAQAASPVAFAPHIRKSPLAGMPPKAIIFQFAKGDQTVVNPTSSAFVRAGDLADRTTFFRNDLVMQAEPTTPPNPHAFLTRILGAPPLSLQATRQAQQQIAAFFASDGAMFLDPDGDAAIFETPIAGGLAGLPEVLNLPMAPGGMMGMRPAGAPRMGAPGMAAPGMGAPRMAPPGMAAPGMGAPRMAAPGMAAPGMAAPGMPGPAARGPQMPPPPTATAPPMPAPTPPTP